tara:strand:+ start:670 stop:1188 length:519 start_codon:yes stop_codon:yes gene_type:complete
VTRRQRKVLLGRINAAYGLKGWVKVFSYTDPLEQILNYNPWTLRRRNVDKQVVIEQGRKHGKGLVARLAGAENRDHAEALIGSEIWGELPDLEDGDVYWHQLQGMVVENEVGELLGSVDHMMETGANDVMVVEPTLESIDDKKRLIPYVDEQVVVDVDLEGGRIVVNWLADY